MAETQVLGWGTKNAPSERVTKDREVFALLAIDATFDGSGAAGAFVPAVQIISDAGEEVGTFPLGSTLTAGDSATVTFAPFLGRGSSSTALPPATQLDYAEPPPGTLNIAATTAATAQQWIVGNPVSFDGNTRIRIEVWVMLANTTHDVVAELYDNGVDVARIAQLSIDFAAGAQPSVSLYGNAIITPAAGTHTFEIRAWRDAAGTGQFLNPTPFPFTIFAPSFYTITVA